MAYYITKCDRDSYAYVPFVRKMRPIEIKKDTEDDCYCFCIKIKTSYAKKLINLYKAEEFVDKDYPGARYWILE